MKYDIVGSFFLPEKLLTVRNQYAVGTIDRESLYKAENDAIEQLVRHQINAGLAEATSGEFRRTHWDMDFWFGLNGIRCERVESGHVYQPIDPFTDIMQLTGRIAYNPDHPFFDDFSFLHKISRGSIRCRQTIPSPANLFFEILSMTEGYPSPIYPDANCLLNDITSAYNKTFLHFYELGCRHIQLDDTACGFLCDDNYTKRLLQGGTDLLALHEQIISLFNRSIAGILHDMEMSLYLSGGDTIVPEWEFLQFPDNIMPKILSQANVSKFFMPFDIGNDYQLEVLRHVPDGKNVVLGLTDAHTPLSESSSSIIETLSKASKHIPQDCLSVSPKTGFKLSSYAPRGLTYEDQWNKIAQLRNISEHFTQIF